MEQMNVKVQGTQDVVSMNIAVETPAEWGEYNDALAESIKKTWNVEVNAMVHLGGQIVFTTKDESALIIVRDLDNDGEVVFVPMDNVDPVKTANLIANVGIELQQ